MIVVTLTDCPPSLRGDLTKWLFEIQTGVYVGQMNARVRDKIWERIQAHVKCGYATMVYQTNNEQGLSFRVHNTSWKPIDFDGLKLMLRPIRKEGDEPLPAHGFSHAAMRKKATAFREKTQNDRQKDDKQKDIQNIPEDNLHEECVVLDIETTGFSLEYDEIIEIGAIRVLKNGDMEKFQKLIAIDRKVPEAISKLTGITDEMLSGEGVELEEALREFISFAGQRLVIGHNIKFDMSFIREACNRCGLPLFSNRALDTLELARRKAAGVANYRLQTLLSHYGIEPSGAHRSLADCESTYALYLKIRE